MKLVLIGFVLFGLASAELSCECGMRHAGRRIGGGLHPKNEYPWMVGFQKENTGYTFCAGTIITQRHVISAAHCFEGTTADEIVMFAGSKDINDESTQLHSVEEIIIHPKYDNSKQKLNDIAIVVTSEEMKYNEFVGPICMPIEDLGREIMDQFVRVLGWGRYEPNLKNYDTVNKLREGDIQIVSNRLCDNQNAALLCAQFYGRNTCMGDSGGPLAWLDSVESRFTLVGVTSYGYSSCGKTTSTTVNTDVAGHLTWINRQIQRLKGDVKTCHRISRSPYLTEED